MILLGPSKEENKDAVQHQQRVELMQSHSILLEMDMSKTQ